MSLLAFAHASSAPLDVWVHSADDESAPDAVWPGLWEMEYPTDRRLNPYFRFGINNGDGEAFAVWRAAAFAMCDGLTCLAIPMYYRDQSAALLGLDREHVDLIDWEYEVDNERGTISDADKGFVTARACVPIRPESDEFQRRNAARAGLFRIESMSDFTALEVAVSGDVSSEVTLLAVRGSTRFGDVLQALRGDARPMLEELLEPGEIFIDVSIVRDRFLGQTSYLVVKSHEDQGDTVRKIAEHYNAAWDAYLATVEAINTFEEFADVTDELLAPPG